MTSAIALIIFLAWIAFLAVNIIMASINFRRREERIAAAEAEAAEEHTAAGGTEWD